MTYIITGWMFVLLFWTFAVWMLIRYRKKKNRPKLKSMNFEEAVRREAGKLASSVPPYMSYGGSGVTFTNKVIKPIPVPDCNFDIGTSREISTYCKKYEIPQEEAIRDLVRAGLNHHNEVQVALGLRTKAKHPYHWVADGVIRGNF